MDGSGQEPTPLPGQMADDDLKQILSGLFSIAAGVGALRTHEGSAHGHANKSYKIEARHARLAVHAAHTMTLFIWRRGKLVAESETLVMLILEPRRGRGGDATPHLVLPDALPP